MVCPQLTQTTVVPVLTPPPPPPKPPSYWGMGRSVAAPTRRPLHWLADTAYSGEATSSRVLEKLLLPGGENKFLTAVATR